MNWHTCKSLLNTSGRAVEQLAGCLAKQAKVSSRGPSRTASAKLSYQYLMRCVTPIAPPTGCGIRPVPNRNLSTRLSVVVGTSTSVSRSLGTMEVKVHNCIPRSRVVYIDTTGFLFVVR